MGMKNKRLEMFKDLFNYRGNGDCLIKGGKNGSDCMARLSNSNRNEGRIGGLYDRVVGR